MGQYDGLAKELKAEIKRRYAGKRLELHINSVAQFARKTAARIAPGTGIPDKVFIAGLAHDLYKGFSGKDLRDYILAQSVPLDSETWRLGGGLLHGPAAAHYLRSVLGVTDNDILDAVFYHTTSHPEAGLVEKILVCADYLEPNRPQRAEESDVRALGRRVVKALDEVYSEVLGRKLIYTLVKGRPLHSNGVAAWNAVSLNGRDKK